MRAYPLSKLRQSSTLKTMGALGVAALLTITNANAAGESNKQMLKDAKVDRTHAEVIALGRARGGKIKTSRIERTNERLLWSFEIVMPETARTTEVLVDAKTGKVISVKKR